MNIHGFAQRLVFVDVDDDDLVGNVLESKRKRGRGTHAAGTDHGDFVDGHEKIPLSLYVREYPRLLYTITGMCANTFLR